MRRHDESGAADAAFRQPREQVLRPLRRPDGARCLHRVPRLFLTRLRSRPEVVRHDPQLRDFPRHPLGCRVEPRHALSGVRILHVAKAIPDQAADVELVVEDAGSALGVAVDRARTPWTTERTWHTLAIQVLRDLLRRHACDEVAEDALDDRGLGRFDLPLARRHGSAADRLDDSIAVAEAAGRLAVLDSAAQSTVRLLGQVLQEQGVHRALESDVQVRDVALGERDDVDAGKGQSLEEAGGVFLVAAEPVQRLGEDDIESAIQRIAHQRLETRAEQRRTGHRVVRVLLADRPALPLGERAAHAQLIGDRRVPLVVRGVARVDGDLHVLHLTESFVTLLQFQLETLACSLPRQGAHERAKRLVRRHRRCVRSPSREREPNSAGRVPFGVVVFRP